MTVIAFLIGVVLLVVGLAVSIALHEIGHLVPAKKFGVRVGQYMIGFGPTLWSRRIGETEYGVKALPLGGYISMAGMYPPSPDATATADAPAAGAPAAAGTAGKAGGGFFATMVQDARLANDETLAGDDGRRAFYELPVWQRVIVMLGGPLMNLVLAVVLFAIVFSGIGVQTATTTIAAVSECVLPSGSTQTACAPDDPASPAAEAGIQPGDVIVSVDGTDVDSFAAASAIIQAAPNRTLDVVVRRDGAEQTLRVTPMLAEREVRGADGAVTTAEVGFVGMTATTEYVRQPIWEGPEAAVAQAGQVAGIMWQLPARVYQTAADMIAGHDRDPNGPLSVVGVGRLAGEVAATDAPVLDRVSTLLGLLGSLNIALFVFNLIPLLPLDGGHIVVALWDGIKRAWAKLWRRPPPAPVDATRLVPVTFVVVIALVVMGGILILADLINPVQLLG
ncbi:M50 family metallopeptidase [Microbacterium aurum]